MSIHYLGDIDDAGDVHPFRVAVRDNVSAAVTKLLADTPAIDVVDDVTTAQAALIRSTTKFKTADIFRQWDQLMLLARVGVGTDNIDMKLASEMGIATINTPGASTEAVATRAVTFMLAWAARLKEGTSALSAATWPKGDPQLEPLELEERTLGIIGYGRIGRSTAEKATPFFGNVIYTDAVETEGMVSMQELLSKADVISIHASGNKPILSPELLATISAGRLIVNTSRGGVIDAEALLAAMERGVSVALDVFPQEGPEMFSDNILKKITQHPLFIGTPHTAASGEVTQRKLGMEGAEYVTKFARQGIVNAGNIPGHTLSRLLPTERAGKGVRGIMTHPSVKGTIAKIGAVADNQGLNITQLCNEQGHSFGAGNLAITSFDLDEGEIDGGLKLLRGIKEKINVLKSRLLLFGNGD